MKYGRRRLCLGMKPLLHSAGDALVVSLGDAEKVEWRGDVIVGGRGDDGGSEEDMSPSAGRSSHEGGGTLSPGAL